MDREELLFALSVRIADLVKGETDGELSDFADAEIDRIESWVDINFPSPGQPSSDIP